MNEKVIDFLEQNAKFEDVPAGASAPPETPGVNPG
jgi:hypothetical protein